MASARAVVSQSKDILIVIDVQNCFLSGGGLGGGTPESKKVFTDKIHSLIQSGKFNDVYFTQDIHHPENVSMRNTYAKNNARVTKNANFGGAEVAQIYDLGKMAKWSDSSDKRRWRDPDARQVLWPRHCIVPETNPFYPGGPRNTSKFNTITNANSLGSSGKDGIDLGGILHEYTTKAKGNPGGNFYHVYKGFAPSKDSYSAIADAYGEFDPFIAGANGVFPNGGDTAALDKAMNNKFANVLLNEINNGDIANIYICGIARDFCVKWTALDLLDLVVFNKDTPPNDDFKPKIHYLFDLTIQIYPGTTEETLTKDATDLLTKIGETKPVSNYFVVENSAMTGGRRTKVRHTKRNCKCGKAHKKCKCGKASKGHKKTRRCL
jgi:nicotinamidase-related amidase